MDPWNRAATHRGVLDSSPFAPHSRSVRPPHGHLRRRWWRLICSAPSDTPRRPVLLVAAPASHPLPDRRLRTFAQARGLIERSHHNQRTRRTTSSRPCAVNRARCAALPGLLETCELRHHHPSQPRPTLHRFATSRGTSARRPRAAREMMPPRDAAENRHPPPPSRLVHVEEVGPSRSPRPTRGVSWLFVGFVGANHTSEKPSNHCRPVTPSVPSRRRRGSAGTGRCRAPDARGPASSASGRWPLTGQRRVELSRDTRPLTGPLAFADHALLDAVGTSLHRRPCRRRSRRPRRPSSRPSGDVSRPRTRPDRRSTRRVAVEPAGVSITPVDPIVPTLWFGRTLIHRPPGRAPLGRSVQ